MKKILGVLVAGILLFSCCAVFAEGETATSPDLSGFDFSKLEEGITQGTIVLQDESSFAIAPTSDKVTVAGNMVSVQNGGVFMLLTLPDAYLCFTQDYNASLQTYAMLNDQSLREGLQNHMVQNDIHYYLLDMYTTNESAILSIGPDQASMMIYNMKNLNSSDLNDIGAAFAQGGGVSYGGSYSSSTATWLKFTGKVNMYMTIVGGQYIVYQIGNASSADAEGILSALSIY